MGGGCAGSVFPGGGGRDEGCVRDAEGCTEEACLASEETERAQNPQQPGLQGDTPKNFEQGQNNFSPTLIGSAASSSFCIKIFTL